MDAKAIDVFVGERLKARRTTLGLNQRELAKKLQLSHQQIQKYERGENRIGASILYKIAEILGVEATYFFDGCKKVTPLRSSRKKEATSSLYAGSVEELIALYHKLPLSAQKNIIVFMKSLVSSK